MRRIDVRLLIDVLDHGGTVLRGIPTNYDSRLFERLDVRVNVQLLTLENTRLHSPCNFIQHIKFFHGDVRILSVGCKQVSELLWLLTL